MTRLGTMIPNVNEFPQTLKNMTAASETLYNLFKNQKIWVYADAQLREHMKHAQAEDKGKGFRIVKPRKAAVHHTDAAIALAMAAFWAYKTHGVDTSQPIKLEVPFADGSEYGANQENKEYEDANLPIQLRGGGMTEEEFDNYWDQYVKKEGVNA